MKPINPHFPFLLHGGDYSPEQWSPETWDQDLQLMKQAHCNSLSLGIFAWANLEPEEGRYTFDWLDAMMERMAAHRYPVVLATPSSAPPIWMARAYPEIRRVEQDGERHAPGNRVNFCPTSPRYRAKVAAINRELAVRYGRHPMLYAWHVSNEYCFHCYCDLCQAAFRDWLRARYGTIEALNEAWWAHFWSQRFMSWEEIEPPGGKRIFSMEGLVVDWHRFQTAQLVEFMKHEIAALRPANPGVPVTTNLMGAHLQFDYWKVAAELDVVSLDSYPAFHHRADTVRIGVESSFVYDMYRSFKGGRPWMLMESTPSSANWMSVMKLKRPGLHLLSSLQAVAHGADTVQYFQWRKGRGGREKFHGAVVDHASDAHSRVFRDVAETGAVLEQLTPVVGATSPARVAVIYDWENRWTIDATCGPRREKKDCLGACIDHYRPFWARGLTVDVINEEADVSAYDVVVAPMLHMVRGDLGARLTEFVARGGTLVTTYWSGIVDERTLCFTNGFPGPLRQALGIRSEEIDVLYDDESVPVQSSSAGAALGGPFTATLYCDLIHTEGAEVVATYAGEFYAGRPALTVNRFGEGRAWYVAFRGDEAFLDALYARVIAESGLTSPLAAPLPEGVTVQRRTAGAREFLFVLNFAREPRAVDLGAGGRSLPGGRDVSGVVTLPAYGTLILERSITP
jgi:beta-galactosidase